MNKIKIMLYAIIAMFTTTISACSDDDDNNRFENLPVEVQKAFSNKYPDARVDEWEKKDIYYVIEFNIGRTEAEAWYEGSMWVMTELDATIDKIPAAVADAFKKSPYSQWRIDDIDIVERNAMPTLYVIEVEMGKNEAELYYFEDGTLFKEIIENDYDDNGYLPQIPSKVKEAIVSMYPGAKILDAEFEKGMYEVEILHENLKKDVFFNHNLLWSFTKWDVRISDLPDAVISFIDKNYPGFKIDDAEIVTTANDGVYYEIELEKGESEVEIKITPSGELKK